MSGLTLPVEGLGCQAHGTTNSPGRIPRLLVRENTCPARHQTPIFGHCEHTGRTFSCPHPHQAEQGDKYRAQHAETWRRETNNTTARPQQGTTETAITFAPTNCTKNAHFSPAKATMVSNHRAAWPTGPGCSTRGRRRGLAGLRADTPSEARGADGSRAGRRPRAHQAARPACTHNDTRPQPVSRPRPRHAHAAALSTAPPAIRRSCPRDPQPRRGQPRGGRRGRGTGSRTRSPGPRHGRSGSTAGRHRARHTRRA